jgi:hypothetical protein
MTVSERASPYDRRRDIADKPVSEACFNDWKRFCFVLREIASGENGRPLSSLEAQTRAQAVLTECGYTWPGRAQVHEPVVAPTAAPESPNAQAPVESNVHYVPSVTKPLDGALSSSMTEHLSASGPQREILATPADHIHGFRGRVVQSAMRRALEPSRLALRRV